MKSKFNETLQWLGAAFIILGHVFNSIGPSMYPWNIVVFATGASMFLTWAYRVNSRPQAVVNLVSLVVAILGLYKAFV
jgi:hypothetical protein